MILTLRRAECAWSEMRLTRAAIMSILWDDVPTVIPPFAIHAEFMTNEIPLSRLLMSKEATYAPSCEWKMARSRSTFRISPRLNSMLSATQKTLSQTRSTASKDKIANPTTICAKIHKLQSAELPEYVP